MELKVGVIRDWAPRGRGEFWKPVLRGQGHKYMGCSIADRLPPLAQRGAASFLDVMRAVDVLVINWDAANGDPEFGADLTWRWIEHHQREIWKWVRDGNVLIIEGQAVLGVPDQRAYDAILGRGEVFVCGDEDPLDPARQRYRHGDEARVTKRSREGGFSSGLERLRTVTVRPYIQMFPDEAVDPILGEQTWGFLYRGWFVPRPRRRKPSKFEWHVVARTLGDRRRDRHPICLAARHGKGVIFATTMLIASTGQKELIAMMVACHGRGELVPARRRRDRLEPEHVLLSLIPPIFALIAAHYLKWDARGEFAATTAGVAFSTAIVVLPRAARRLRRRGRDRQTR